MFYTHDYEQKKYISEPHFMISIMGCLGLFRSNKSWYLWCDVLDSSRKPTTL